jgi:ABC-type dipeptide/oligopeptide/nickel transport system permease subunit
MDNALNVRKLNLAESAAVEGISAPPGVSLWQDAWRRLKKDKLAILSLFVLVLYCLVAILTRSGLLASDWSQEIAPSYGPPALDNWRLWLGADIFGRSVLLKGVMGAYVSISVAVLSTLIAVPLGVVLGAVAGYFGGVVDDVITWFYTTLSNIPSLLLLISLAYIMDKGIISMSIALGATNWVTICRLIRGEFMKHKEREYVQAAKSLGASHARRIFTHILPNVTHLIIIQISFLFVSAILSEVVLSYLGLGVQGLPSWGTMIDEAKLELARGVWWQLATATGFIFFLALALNILGDALRDSLDPKLR